VWVGALTGPLGRRDALDALHRSDAIEKGSDPLANYGVSYPPLDRATALQPLLPDRLAEDLLADLWGAGESSSTDPWFAEALGRLLEPNEDGQYPAFAGRALAVVVETARRWPAIAAQQLDPLLHSDPALASCARGSTLVELADVVSPDVLEAVEARLSQLPSLDHDAAAAEIGQRVVDRATGRDDPVELACRLIRLSGRMRNVGRHREALAAATRAEKLLTQVEGHDESRDDDLAQALVSQDVALAELGDPKRGLERSLRALEISLRLSEENATRHQPAVAKTLTNLGHRFSQLGDNPAAVMRSREAVRIYRELADKDPKWYPDLGWALINLGAQLADQGRHSDALPYTEDAVTILDLFAKMNPHVEPDLACALGNHAAQLTATGRATAAVVPAERAVAILERWSERNPAYSTDLAVALLKAKEILALAGHLDRALDYAERYEGLNQRLALTGHPPIVGLPLTSHGVWIYAPAESSIPTQGRRPNRAARRRAWRSQRGS
jgi:tetratricopeptide (TPR) repeat protein